jgi:N utilization substance protein A
VQSVVQELRGEKIDIIPWNMDPAKFVVNGLAPAVISKVIIDQANRNMEVIVPDDQLSLAIGKRGQNVRLASKLTNWRIDVKSESRHERLKQAGYQSLLEVSGLTEDLADRLYEAGITSLADFAEAALEYLEELAKLTPSVLTAMQEDARQLIESSDAEAADMTDELELDQLAETELTDVSGSQSNMETAASDADAPPATEAN